MSSPYMHDFRGDVKGKTTSKSDDSNEEKTSFSRLAQMRALHSGLIDVESSLSNPKRRFDDIKTMSPFRQLDSSFRSNSRDEISRSYTPLIYNKHEQIKEVLDVKRILAAKRIPCSMENLENGLLNPEMESLSPLILPKGGELLLVNPFSKIKKKKGKKKKGKKKKKR